MFDYMNAQQATQFDFIRIPKVLMTGNEFSGVSNQSKILYGVLLDRMKLSMENHWLDDRDRVYVIYPMKEMHLDLNMSSHKLIECLEELEQSGLVERKKRGKGMPDLLYIKKIVGKTG